MTLWPQLEESLARAAARNSDASAVLTTQSVRVRSRRTTLGTGLVAGTVIAAVLAVLLVGRGKDATSTAMGDPLTRAARAALDQPSLFPRDNQYFFVRTEGTEPTGMSTKSGRSINAVETLITDRWQSAGRTILQRTRILGLHFASAQDAAYWRANGGKKSQVGATQSDSIPPSGRYGIDIGRGELTRAQVLALPGSPKALYALLVPSQGRIVKILRDAPASVRSQVAKLRTEYGSLDNYLAYTAFNAITSSFEQSPMPPTLRGAMYGALALIHGVKAAGLDRDLVGRRGNAVEFTDHFRGIRTELIFDPDTSALLGERQTAIGKDVGFRAGSLIENLAYLDEAITNNLTVPHTNRLY
jgi:hypothetical protein